jgi:hypothetical protein
MKTKSFLKLNEEICFIPFLIKTVFRMRFNSSGKITILLSDPSVSPGLQYGPKSNIIITQTDWISYSE